MSYPTRWSRKRTFVVSSWNSEQDEWGGGGGGRRITDPNLPSPYFEFEVDPTIPYRVCFTSTSTTPVGVITSEVWTFNDGTGNPPLEGNSVCYTFPGPGTYPVTLTVTNNLGLTSPITIPVTVADAPPTPDAIIDLIRIDETITVPNNAFGVLLTGGRSTGNIDGYKFEIWPTGDPTNILASRDFNSNPLSLTMPVPRPLSSTRFTARLTVTGDVGGTTVEDTATLEFTFPDTGTTTDDEPNAVIEIVSLRDTTQPGGGQTFDLTVTGLNSRPETGQTIGNYDFELCRLTDGIQVDFSVLRAPRFIGDGRFYATLEAQPNFSDVQSYQWEIINDAFGEVRPQFYLADGDGPVYEIENISPVAAGDPQVIATVKLTVTNTAGETADVTRSIYMAGDPIPGEETFILSQSAPATAGTPIAIDDAGALNTDVQWTTAGNEAIRGTYEAKLTITTSSGATDTDTVQFQIPEDLGAGTSPQPQAILDVLDVQQTPGNGYSIRVGMGRSSVPPGSTITRYELTYENVPTSPYEIGPGTLLSVSSVSHQDSTSPGANEDVVTGIMPPASGDPGYYVKVKMNMVYEDPSLGTRSLAAEPQYVRIAGDGVVIDDDGILLPEFFEFGTAVLAGGTGQFQTTLRDVTTLLAPPGVNVNSIQYTVFTSTGGSESFVVDGTSAGRGGDTATILPSAGIFRTRQRVGTDNGLLGEFERLIVAADFEYAPTPGGPPGSYDFNPINPTNQNADSYLWTTSNGDSVTAETTTIVLPVGTVTTVTMTITVNGVEYPVSKDIVVEDPPVDPGAQINAFFTITGVDLTAETIEITGGSTYTPFNGSSVTSIRYFLPGTSVFVDATSLTETVTFPMAGIISGSDSTIVALLITDDLGNEDRYFIPYTAPTIPVANFTATVVRYNPVTDIFVVDFDGSASGPDVVRWEYLWLDDPNPPTGFFTGGPDATFDVLGADSGGQSRFRKPAQNGTYDLQLIVYNSSGIASQPAVVPVTFMNPAAGFPPIISVTDNGIDQPGVNSVWNYQDATTDDGVVVTLEYDFGDGSPIQNIVPGSTNTHTFPEDYENDQTYNVSVRAVDDEGNDTGFNIQVVITVPRLDPAPVTTPDTDYTPPFPVSTDLELKQLPADSMGYNLIRPTSAVPTPHTQTEKDAASQRRLHEQGQYIVLDLVPNGNEGTIDPTKFTFPVYWDSDQPRRYDVISLYCCWANQDRWLLGWHDFNDDDEPYQAGAREPGKLFPNPSSSLVVRLSVIQESGETIVGTQNLSVITGERRTLHFNFDAPAITGILNDGINMMQLHFDTAGTGETAAVAIQKIAVPWRDSVSRLISIDSALAPTNTASPLSPAPFPSSTNGYNFSGGSEPNPKLLGGNIDTLVSDTIRFALTSTNAGTNIPTFNSTTPFQGFDSSYSTIYAPITMGARGDGQLRKQDPNDALVVAGNRNMVIDDGGLKHVMLENEDVGQSATGQSTLVLISDSNRFTTVYRYLRTFVNPGAFPSGVPFTFNPFDDLYFKQYYTFAGAVIADLSFTDIGQPGTFAEISLRTDPANPPDAYKIEDYFITTLRVSGPTNPTDPLVLTNSQFGSIGTNTRGAQIEIDPWADGTYEYQIDYVVVGNRGSATVSATWTN